MTTRGRALRGCAAPVDPRSGAVVQNYTTPASVASWYPWAVAVDNSTLYVGDFRSSSVFKFALASGAVVAQFSVSRGLSGVSRPSDLTFDSLGWLYVADRVRVWKLDPSDGTLLAMWNWSTISMSPASKGSFQFIPQGVACDDSDRLCVSN